MNKTELAKALQISRQALYKFLLQGVPVNDLQAAIDWRGKNQNFFRTEEYRTGLAAVRERLEAERQCKIS
jgi:hypothetical protein